jgi:4'-phosphopantetheinyl transferase
LAISSEVQVVAARLDPTPQKARALALLLSHAERSRAARFRFDRERRRFIVARAQLRELLAERLDVPSESIEFVYAREGKPALAERFARSGWRFNLSHCDELVLYAFSREREVGVDVEAIRPVDEADSIGEHFFAPGERCAFRSLEREERNTGFLRLWTRKEALAKALGDGLAVPLERLDASAPPCGWSIESFSPEPGFIGALAVQE